MKYLRCQSCGKFTESNQPQCQICGRVFNAIQSNEFLMSKDVVDPSLTILLINLVNENPGKTGKFYTTLLNDKGYNIPQFRVNHCLYYNEELFKPNLNAKKIPAWTLIVHKNTIRIDISKTTLKPKIVESKNPVHSNEKKTESAQELIVKQDKNSSLNLKSKLDTMGESLKPSSITKEPNNKTQDVSNDSFIIKYIRLDMSEDAKEEYQDAISEMDEILLDLMEEKFIDDISIPQIKKNIDSLAPYIKHTQKKFIESYEKMSEFLTFDDSKLEYILTHMKKIGNYRKVLIIVDSNYIGIRINKALRSLINCKDLSHQDYIGYHDLENFDLSNSEVLIINKKALSSNLSSIVFNLCIVLSILGNKDVVTTVTNQLFKSKSSETIVEVFCLKNTFEDLVGEKNEDKKQITELKSDKNSTIVEKVVESNRNEDIKSEAAILDEVKPQIELNNLNIENVTKIDENTYYIEADSDYSELQDYRYVPQPKKEIEKQIVFESAVQSDLTHSLLPHDMNKAFVKILGSTKLTIKDIIEITKELGFEDDCVVFDDFTGCTGDQVADLMNGQISDILVGKILNKKEINIENRLIETVKRNVNKYPNMIMLGKGELKITKVTIRNALLISLKYQYIKKTGHFTI